MKAKSSLARAREIARSKASAELKAYARDAKIFDKSPAKTKFRPAPKPITVRYETIADIFSAIDERQRQSGRMSKDDKFIKDMLAPKTYATYLTNKLKSRGPATDYEREELQRRLKEMAYAPTRRYSIEPAPKKRESREPVQLDMFPKEF